MERILYARMQYIQMGTQFCGSTRPSVSRCRRVYRIEHVL